jgi:hypothetical protein
VLEAASSVDTGARLLTEVNRSAADAPMTWRVIADAHCTGQFAAMSWAGILSTDSGLFSS